MVLSVLIVAVSLALFLYWFRYTCILILSTRTTRDYSEEVAASNFLRFAEIQRGLDSGSLDDLGAARESLDRDYRLVTSLLQQAGGVQVGGESLEDIMLRIDFRLMQAWSSLVAGFSAAGSRVALEEMTEIVAHFANQFGERVRNQAGA